MQQKIEITPDIEAQLLAGIEHHDIVNSMETLNIITSKYLIGNISIQACMGHFVLLMMIENPLICPDEDGKATMDEQATMEALYVLDGGEDAIAPLMRMKQNEAKINHYYKLLEKNPGVKGLIQDMQEEIFSLEEDFRRAAREHFKQFEDLDFELVVADLLCITREIMELTEQIPIDESSSSPISKKKHLEQSL